MWERITEYLQLFGVNISSMYTYFEPQIRLGIWSLAHLIRLCYPTTGNLRTLARSRQAYSVTHRKDYKPFQSDPTGRGGMSAVQTEPQLIFLLVNDFPTCGIKM